MMLAPWMNIAILSLNLHGYHPMGEPSRYVEDRSGEIKLSTSDLFYFTPEEIARGSELRAEVLANDLARLGPDWIFFQEVGAGNPDSPKNCDTFYRHPRQSARRIAELMERAGKRYQLFLACRGNRGWWTDDGLFQDQRALRKKGAGYEVVYDFGANPYPDGMIVEGYAALVDPKWEVLDHRVDFVQANPASERALVELLVLRLAGGTSPDWFMVANVHLAHKLANFEQSVAAREYLADREVEFGKRFGSKNQAGFFVVGDFNSMLFRPRSGSSVRALPEGEISSIPWEMKVPGEYDLLPPLSTPAWNDVAKRLTDLNFNSKYKPWATVKDGVQVKERVADIAERYAQLDRRGALPLADAFTESRARGLCLRLRDIPSACDAKEQIDHLFYRMKGSLRGAAIVYPENDFKSLKGVSDHPGIYFEFVR